MGTGCRNEAGLADLTGRADGPPTDLPSGFLTTLDQWTVRIAEASASVGMPVELDGAAILSERARLSSLTRQGAVSCGGSCHLVRASDGWLAVSLSRDDDWELLPAWLGADPGAGSNEDWGVVHERCRDRSVDDLVTQGALLGLPIGALPPTAPTTPTAPWHPTPMAAASTAQSSDAIGPLRVVDLSSMWAGPLCGRILALAGAEVVKVESSQRPDGSRLAPGGFYEVLNGGKSSLSIDLDSAEGRVELAELLRSADVVIEASRPRALAQLGIDAAKIVSESPTVWVSITGHGRWGDDAHRVAFGDDAAVAGGLVAWDESGPMFVADAVADPLTGIVAAALVLEAVTEARSGILDVAMSGVASLFTGAQAT